MSESPLNLSSLITAIRTELETADLAQRSDGKSALFRLDGMELELHFTVKTSDSVKGGFDLKVVSLGSTVGGATEEVQKIKIKFQASREALARELPGSRFHDDPPVRPKRSRSTSVEPLNRIGEK